MVLLPLPVLLRLLPVFLVGRLFCMLFAISSDFVETLRSLSFCFDLLASMAETEEQIVMSFFDYLCVSSDGDMVSDYNDYDDV